MYHIDLYRLGTPGEVLELGLDEYLYGDGLCVVEWADKALDLFPKDHLAIRIEHVAGTTRRLTLATSARGYFGVLDAVRSSLGDWWSVN